MKTTYTLFVFMLGAMLCFTSCKKKIDKNATCSSGKAITTIDNSGISQTVKDKIFKPRVGSRYITAGHGEYNPSGRTLIIPFEFTDMPHNTAVSESIIRDAFFNSGGLGNDNIKSYFEKNSFGHFTLTEAFIAPWINLGAATAVYTGGVSDSDWTRNAVLCQDICQAANVDWAAIDLNGDHEITANEVQIIFMYSDGGLGANRGHNVTIQTLSGTYNIHNRFTYISCKSNSDPAKTTDPIAYNYVTIRHELMHAFLGLPDRYGTPPNFGRTGNYDPMCANRPRWTSISAPDKMKLGWITPAILTYDHTIDANAPTAHQCYTFTHAAGSGEALVLYNERYPEECWVVENRCNDCATFGNFESGLPESGLAIWWMSLTDERVFLIDASVTPKKPDAYTDFQDSDALFRFKGNGTSTEFIPLYPLDGFVAFNFRMVSGPGAVMSAEF